MHLLDFPAVSADTVRMIADQHGLGVHTFSRLPSVGVFNAIYLLDDNLVLRVPRNHPTFVAALAKEAIAVPAARAAGVHTPPLVAFDGSMIRSRCCLCPLRSTSVSMANRSSSS